MKYVKMRGLRGLSRLLVCCGLLLTSTYNFAQSVSAINGTSSTTNNGAIPISSNYKHSYSQQIYTAAEIIAGGGHAPSKITKIRLYVTGLATNLTTHNEWNVYLGTTTQSTFSGTNAAAWIPSSQLTQVYSGIVNFGAVDSWLEITLNQPYEYTGGNLVVAVDRSNTSYTYGTTFGMFSISPAASLPIALYYRSDSDDINVSAPTNSPSTSTSVRNRIELVMDCGVTPQGAESTVCIGSNGSIAGITSYANTDFHWYDAAENGNLIGTGYEFQYTDIQENLTVYGGYSSAICPLNPLATFNVLVTPVSLSLAPVNVGCITDNNGSFYISNVDCGTAPFLFSVNGGEFGAIPTNLTSGQYTIIVKDANNNVSTPIALNITAANSISPSAPEVVNPMIVACSGASEVTASAVSSGSSSATYQGGNISTMYQASSVSTNTVSTCPGVLSVPVPVGATITAVDVTYTMVAVGSGEIDEQRSYLKCVSAGGTAEAALSMQNTSGAGTHTYSRTGLTIANGIVSTGTVDFQLHAFRTYGGSGCNETYNYVSNNSFTVTVHYAINENDIQWFDAVEGGNLIGTGITINTSIAPYVSDNNLQESNYTIYASTNNGCASATRTPVNIEIKDVLVSITPINESCLGYADGSLLLGQAACGVEPFEVSVDGGDFGPIPTNLASGTYSVQLKDAIGNLSALTQVTISANSSVIPANPILVSEQDYICTGTTAHTVSVLGGGSVTATHTGDNLPTSYNNSLQIGGATAGVVSSCPIPLSVNIPVGVPISSIDVTYKQTSLGLAYLNEQRSYLKCINPGGTQEPTFFGGDLGAAGTFTYNRLGLDIANGATHNGVLDFELHVFRDYGGSGCTTTNSYVNAGSFAITVHYGDAQTTTVWYNAAQDGSVIGGGHDLEVIDPNIIPMAVPGDYVVYAEALKGQCKSVERTPVTITVSDVNVELASIDASCNNGNDGSFALVNNFCGVEPLTYSINGSEFGPIPTDLQSGTIQVQLKDDFGLLSPVYELYIGSAPAPSDLVVTNYNNEMVELAWSVNGNEDSWNIEYGPVGFTPGIGEATGVLVANQIPFAVTGLEGSTEYEFYVSANCGANTTTGSWVNVTKTTDCSSTDARYFCDDFSETSETVDCWGVIDVNNDGYNGTGANLQMQYNTWALLNHNLIGITNGNISNTAYASYNTTILGAADYLVTPRVTLTGNEVLTFRYAMLNNTTPFKVMMSTNGKAPEDFNIELLAPFTGSPVNTFLDTTVVLNYVGDAYIAFVKIAPTASNRGVAIDDVCITVCTPNATPDATLAVCRAEGSVNLDNVINSEYAFGNWSFASNPYLVNGSNFNIATIVAGSYDVSYIVQTACTSDTTIATIVVENQISAGENGMMEACKNQPINLYGGLTGAPQMGGTWYAPNGTAMDNAYFTVGTVPGQYVYKYVVGDNACGPDTAEVIVVVKSNCNYLGLEEVDILNEIAVSPNPNNGLFQIAGIAGLDFSYEIIDLNGRVISPATAIISTTTNVDLTTYARGVYMVRVFGKESEKVIRIIKN